MQPEHTPSLEQNQVPELWPHQRAAIDATLAAIDAGNPSGLIAMPTGSGKSAMFVTVASRLALPTLVLVHRDELVTQLVEMAARFWPGATVGVVKAESDEWREDQQLVIGSVQSLQNGRLARMPCNRFGLIVADEAHHAVAPSWRAVIEHFADRRFLLGTTATPERADGKGLSELFGPEPLYSYPLRQAIEDGVLCRLIQYAVETGASVEGVDVRAGDFATAALSKCVNTVARNRVVVEAFIKHAPDRRALAFAVDIDHAHDLAKAFRDSGIAAGAVDGTMVTKDRRATLERFRNGSLRVVTNCAVLTEGFDDPAIDCVLMARPTKSRGLYQQAVGRGLRSFDGKLNCLILDFTDNSERHKLVTVLDLLGTPKRHSAEGGDVIECVDADERQQEAAHVIQSIFPLAWRLTRVCPWPELPSLKGYVATATWHRQGASEKQTAFLNRMGLDVGRGLTKGEACYLINRVQEYRAAFPEPPTPKQRWFLKSRGAWRNDMTFDEARVLIGRLKRGAA